MLTKTDLPSRFSPVTMRPGLESFSRAVGSGSNMPSASAMELFISSAQIIIVKGRAGLIPDSCNGLGCESVFPEYRH